VNLAFQAVLLLLTYLPGALFILALTGQLSKGLPSASSLTWEVALALLTAAVFHSGFLVVLHAIGFQPDYGAYFILLSESAQGNPDYSHADSYVVSNLSYVSGYFILLSLIAAGTGIVLRDLIGRFALDTRYKWLRFNSPWHYLFGGHDRPNARTTNLDAVACEVLTVLENEPVLYSGFLTRYWFDENNRGLETIFLTNAARQKLNWTNANPGADDADDQNPVVRIPTDEFAIKYADIRNISVRYVETAPAQSPVVPNRVPRGLLPLLIVLIALLAAVLILLVNLRRRIRDLAVASNTKFASLTAQVGENQKSITVIGGRLAKLEHEINDASKASISIDETPFVGRNKKRKNNSNRAVRVNFELRNGGLKDPVRVFLEMKANNNDLGWHWETPTPPTIRNGKRFSLAPGEMQRVNAWIPTSRVSRVEVSVRYSDASGKQCPPIGFCQVYDRKSETTEPCPDWELKQQSRCQ
jgi:hypothetical protein